MSQHDYSNWGAYDYALLGVGSSAHVYGWKSNFVKVALSAGPCWVGKREKRHGRRVIETSAMWSDTDIAIATVTEVRDPNGKLITERPSAPKGPRDYKPERIAPQFSAELDR